MSERKAGYVYIMKPKHANVYKIGESVDVERRLKTLNRKFDFELEIVFVSPAQFKDSFSMESHFQMGLKKYHLGGDWFALTDAALQALRCAIVAMCRDGRWTT